MTLTSPTSYNDMTIVIRSAILAKQIQEFLQAAQYSVHSVKNQILECILLFIGELKRTYL